MHRFTVIFDRDAAADLDAIRDYIKEMRDAAFADAFAEKIIVYCEGLGTTPHRGTLREEIGADIRIVGWRRTVTVAFQVYDADCKVVVLGIFYRGRDVAAALRERT